MGLRMCAKNWSAIMKISCWSLTCKDGSFSSYPSFFKFKMITSLLLGSPVHPSPMDPRLRGYDPTRVASLIPRTKAY